ncbi:MAG TPA: hypothetical protein VK203_01965 [Nostocaceae cyanobacterium]|nr:hypothetical protein [Nostocaceae cyanobacterium]
MQLFRFTLLALILVINLLVALPAWAEISSAVVNNSDYLQIGQKVIWLYKPRADSADVQRIPAEIVKIGSKQVQIKVPKHNHEFINRWVNRNRLENAHNPKEQVSKSM